MRTIAAALALALATSAAQACAPPDGEGPWAESSDPGLEKWVEDLPDPVGRDWGEIRAGDTLRILLVYNSTSYFLYRGEPLGYELEGLRSFAEDHGLALGVTVVRDRAELFRSLNEGKGDVVAARLVPVEAFRGHVAFTRPLYRTRPTVVQRDAPLDSTPIPEAIEGMVDSAFGAAPGAAQRASPSRVIRARLVRSPRQLAGDTVVLPRASEYFQRVVELADSLGETIELVELDSALVAETLIRRVAAGSVRLTVAPENLAELTDEYFTNLRILPAVGPRHPVAWAVRSNATRLRRELDAWLAGRGAETMESLYGTYFVDREEYRERVESEYLTSETGRLSEFDSLFVRHAPSIGWDWRLLASQAYQESRFDPAARSWAGARGLLQLMPATAREVGVSDPSDPAENVAGAVRYLAWLEEQWSEELPDPDARLPFVLASYNAGMGHVEDARRVAAAEGDDPSAWDDVSYWLLQLSKRRHHSRPEVRYGYVRGIEPVTYVSLVLERWAHYREFVTGGPTGLRSPAASPSRTRR